MQNVCYKRRQFVEIIISFLLKVRNSWLNSFLICLSFFSHLTSSHINFYICIFVIFLFKFFCVFKFFKMLKRAKSSFVIQNTCASMKHKKIPPMCQKTFDRNLVIYQNESALKKRWLRNLLTSMLISFGGGFSIIMSHYIRYRIRWCQIFNIYLSTLNELLFVNWRGELTEKK